MQPGSSVSKGTCNRCRWSPSWILDCLDGNIKAIEQSGKSFKSLKNWRIQNAGLLERLTAIA